MSTAAGVSIFRPRFRGAYSDMHCCNHPSVSLSRLDPAEQVAAYKAAGIDNVPAVWGKCHWGYSYYPTRVGVPHPKLRLDYTGEMVKLLHEEGIQAYGYFSLGFDNIGVLTHPEWGARDKSGRLMRVKLEAGKLRWYWACLASSYREYALAQMREMVELYDFDGLFVDINEAHHGEGFCYCNSCCDQIKSIYGVDIAKEELGWEKVVDWWWNKVELGMMRDVRDVVKSVKPDMPLCANADSLQLGREFMDLLDYVFRDCSFFEIGFDQTLHLRSSGLKYYQVGLSGAPEAYDLMPLNMVRTAVSGILAQGGLPALYFEAEKADGSFEKQPLEWFAPVHRETLQKEPYLTDADPVPYMALYFSWCSKLRPGHPHHYVNDLTKALRGAISCFVPAHVPLDVSTSYNASPETLSNYHLLVLPECTNLSDEEAEQIRRFVHGGGKLIATGQTGLFDDRWKQRENFALSDVYGVDFVEIEDAYAMNQTGAWIHFGSVELPGSWAGRLLKAGPCTVRVKPLSGDTIATFDLPCLAETDDDFVCWGPAPPGPRTERPAMHINNYGKGRCLYVAYDIFLQADKGSWWPKRLLLDILHLLLPEHPITVKGSSSLKCSFMLQRAQNRLVVHLVNAATLRLGGECTELGSAIIELCNGYFDVKKATEVFPQRRDLFLEKRGTTTQVRLDIVDVHHIVVLDL